jgi:serine/threonine protein kinase
LYGQLEDETAVGSVRRLAAYEDYALRLLADYGVRVARTYGLVELTPNQEYMLVTEFFENARNLGDSQVDEQVIDEGLAMVRTFWDIGVAHRDIKPANLLVQEGHLQLVDVSALEVRPSPWRQAVDLSNMLLPWPCGATRNGSMPAPPGCSRPTRSPRPSRRRLASPSRPSCRPR